jgi:hypothetical protein
LILGILIIPQFNLLVPVYGQSRKTYYVSPKGNDSNKGSIQSPWSNIEYGVAQLEPGDTLLIRGGIYRVSIHITKTGSPQGYIRIRNYPGERPIIDGSDKDGNGLVISDSSYLNISGIEIRNWQENGIWIESSQYFEINNCTIRDVFYGIGIADGSHDFKINNCVMTEFMLYGFDASPSSGEDCYNGVIKNCIAYLGSDPSQNVDGFATGHGDQRGFTFINCISYEVYDGFDISSDDSFLIGCISFSCINTGYKIWGDKVSLINCIGYDSNTNLELDWSGTPKTVTILHSDFVKSKTFNIWIENKNDRIHIYNSVIACGENIGITFENGYSNTYKGDNNLLHNWDSERMISFAYEHEYSLQDLIEMTWTEDTGQDANSIIVEDPSLVFRKLDNLDLYPRLESKLIDNANESQSIGYDIDYRLRPNGNKSDIGAYEYYANQNITRITDLNFKLNTQITSQEDEVSISRLLLYSSIIIVLALVYVILKKVTVNSHIS